MGEEQIHLLHDQNAPCQGNSQQEDENEAIQRIDRCDVIVDGRRDLLQVLVDVDERVAGHEHIILVPSDVDV